MFNLKSAISPKESFKVEQAISFLIINYNHSGHNPKPVILHSLRVAMLLMEMGYSTKIIIGAVLHDILEDTAVKPEEITKSFGEDILQLIDAVSYDESIKDPVDRYVDMFNRVVGYGKEAVVLKAADIAVNSLYISLVTDQDTQKHLVEKGSYFLKLTEEYSNEPSWQLLHQRNLEEISKLQ